MLLLTGFVTTLDAAEFQQREYSKTIKKEFGITADGTTGLFNKYGRVDVHTWEKNRVKVDVTILVRAESESRAQEVFDRIQIDISNGSDFVRAETIIEPQRKNSWWNWGDTKSDFTIDYDVYIPTTNNLELSNKYGDSFIDEINGNVTLNVKYGNFKAENLARSSSIDLAYGNGTILRANSADVEVSYGRLHSEEVKDLDMTSKYSKINIENANTVRTTSKYDTYNIGEVVTFRNTGKYDNIDIDNVQDVVISSKYTEVYAGEVTNSLELDMQYGGTTIDRVKRGFSEIRLVGSYTDFKINVEDGAHYRMEAVANYAGIRYPERLKVTYEKEKGTYHEVEGYHGERNARSFIKARLDYGGLKVRQNN